MIKPRITALALASCLGYSSLGLAANDEVTIRVMGLDETSPGAVMNSIALPALNPAGDNALQQQTQSRQQNRLRENEADGDMERLREMEQIREQQMLEQQQQQEMQNDRQPQGPGESQDIELPGPGGPSGRR